MLKVIHEPDEKGQYRIAIMYITADANMYWELVSKKKKSKLEAVSEMNTHIEDAIKFGVMSVISLSMKKDEDMKSVGNSAVRQLEKPIENKDRIMKDLKYLLEAHKGTDKHDALVGLMEMYTTAVEEHKHRFQ